MRYFLLCLSISNVLARNSVVSHRSESNKTQPWVHSWRQAANSQTFYLQAFSPAELILLDLQHESSRRSNKKEADISPFLLSAERALPILLRMLYTNNLAGSHYQISRIVINYQSLYDEPAAGVIAHSTEAPRPYKAYKASTHKLLEQISILRLFIRMLKIRLLFPNLIRIKKISLAPNKIMLQIEHPMTDARLLKYCRLVTEKLQVLNQSIEVSL